MLGSPSKVFKKQGFLLNLIGLLNFNTHYLSPLPQNKKLFFAADFHLGAPDYLATQAREKKIIKWLDHIQPDAHALFLLGDIFDAWFEYKQVIPKGFVRIQGKLADFTDQGIPVYFFQGNHEIGLKDYFAAELGLTLCTQPTVFMLDHTRFLLGHGDDLGSTPLYRFIKHYIYHNAGLQWLFYRLHPNLGLSLAAWLSAQSRKRHLSAQSNLPVVHLPIDRIFKFCRDHIEPYQHHDFYVFGHMHQPTHIPLHENSHYYNVGDWINQPTYGVFDGTQFQLVEFV